MHFYNWPDRVKLLYDAQESIVADERMLAVFDNDNIRRILQGLRTNGRTAVPPILKAMRRSESELNRDRLGDGAGDLEAS